MSEPAEVRIFLPELSESACGHVHGGTWWLSGAAARGEMGEEEMRRRVMEARTARRLRAAKSRKRPRG